MSSLIFVVILAVWAVYLVQHWVRRRDHLATARSVDRFSESMRVLERRRALPRPDVVEHAPPAPSVLLRPARPEVVVKRGSGAPAPAPAHTVATAVGPTSTFRRAQLLARARAAGLLLGSVVMLALVGLTIAQVLHWGWSFAGLAVLAVTVAAIRWSVSRDRTARRPAARRPATRRPAASRPAARRPAARRPAAAPRRPVVAPGTAPSPLAAQARATVSVHATPARRAVDLDRRPAPVLYDIDEVETALSATAPSSTSGADQVADVVADVQDVAGGTWSPVPVPPPTYTLKARAHRAPTGSEQLPLDGTEMALDEEFEELPSVDRVG